MVHTDRGCAAGVTRQAPHRLVLKRVPENLTDGESKFWFAFRAGEDQTTCETGVTTLFRNVRFARVRTGHSCCLTSARCAFKKMPKGFGPPVIELALVNVNVSSSGRLKKFSQGRCAPHEAGTWVFQSRRELMFPTFAQRFTHNPQRACLSSTWTGSGSVTLARTIARNLFAPNQSQHCLPQCWRGSALLVNLARRPLQTLGVSSNGRRNPICTIIPKRLASAVIGAFARL